MPICLTAAPRNWPFLAVCPRAAVASLSRALRHGTAYLAAALVLLLLQIPALAQGNAAPAEVGGEANLRLPNLAQVSFLGVDGHRLLLFGLLFCFLGLLFGLVIYMQLKNLPVHTSMREISELIYETCKTYLQNQGKFILLLWVFIGLIAAVYFGVLVPTTLTSIGCMLGT